MSPSIWFARSLKSAETGLNTKVEKMPIRKATRTGGVMNCQTESPTARATTSSSRRDSSTNVTMPPNSTAKGSNCSVKAGAR